MQFVSLTDKGILRTNNEDSCASVAIEGYTLLILADGMGGANSGEVASTKAVEALREYLSPEVLRKLSLSEIPSVLTKFIEKANKLLYELSGSAPEYCGMGTTLDVCLVKEDTAYIAHIGDSRVYKITPEGEITRLTKDHSLVEFMIDNGEITPEEAVNHPQKNVITKALGTTPTVKPDIICSALSDSDRILMCSDGLTNMVSEKDISAVVASDIPLCDRGKQLIDMANKAGGKDNITVILACN